MAAIKKGSTQSHVSLRYLVSISQLQLRHHNQTFKIWTKNWALLNNQPACTTFAIKVRQLTRSARQATQAASWRSSTAKSYCSNPLVAWSHLTHVKAECSKMHQTLLIAPKDLLREALTVVIINWTSPERAMVLPPQWTVTRWKTPVAAVPESERTLLWRLLSWKMQSRRQQWTYRVFLRHSSKSYRVKSQLVSCKWPFSARQTAKLWRKC